MESKTISEASKQNEGNQSDQPTCTKKDISNIKSLKDIETKKNDEGKALVIKYQCINKENQKEIMGQKGINYENQIHLKETQEITNDFGKKSGDETKDETNLVKLSFLYKDVGSVWLPPS